MQKSQFECCFLLKVCGYGDKLAISQNIGAGGDDEEINEESAISGFRALADMLSSLININSDGKIIISRPTQTCNSLEGGYIKYVMLTGEKIFSEVCLIGTTIRLWSYSEFFTSNHCKSPFGQVVDQAHAVVLAGGTLRPIEETKERLFRSLQLNELPFFSCGHIVPSENILPVAVKLGPSGQSFDFSYKARSSSTMVRKPLFHFVSVT